MTLLLDTNVLIWAISDIDSLGKRAAANISNSSHKIYISDVSILEAAIKVRTGKLQTEVDFTVIDEFLVRANIEQLPFDAWAAQHYADLPHMAWADPFDLALISLALAKKMVLVSSDRNILNSSIEKLRTLDARR